ncbi:MAG: lytic transglycosylase domain-containing protein [Oligoflexia bacterium]|nr:lytic transglycosylase domain-containing protein [Oligoflexia bacterium]
MSMPKCNYYDYQPIVKLSPFNPKKQFLGHIKDAAYHEQINPSLLAALIAQESGFNSMAVSHAKAIGLTQVTENAEPHILEDSAHWPQYPKLNQFNVPTIKTLIYLGKVNAQNEWRLNPYLSMRGGAKYLKYLEDYWSSADAKFRIQTHLNSNWDKTSDLILASYNSGPFRVKQELTKYGPDWLNSPKLKEAKKYVSRVRSFCHEFRTAGN